MILLVSDIGELKANPKRSASGTVLEAKLDKGRGPVATVLVQDGTLSVGDTFIAGPIVGRVRALIDDRGKPTKSAGPSTPVEVLGLSGLPQPGDVFQVADAAKARHIATFREEQSKVKALGAKGSRLTLESLQAQIAEGGMKELPIIIKADVQGSAEVLADTLAKLTDEKVKIRIIHAGVGAVNESDVLLASASNAIIIAFNVRPDRNAEDIAARERVEIRQHSVIYNVTDEMKKAMTGLLDPTFKEVRIGVAAVRDIFKVPKFGTIAGCMVTEGRITRSGDSQARLLRDNVVVFTGQDRIPPPLQGRCQRSEDRLRVRHRLRQVQRPQGRRRHRGVRDGTGADTGVTNRKAEVGRRNAVRIPNSGFLAIPDVPGLPPDRVADQIRSELALLLARELHDPGIGFVTITRVQVSPDLQHARVYYTALGDDKARQSSDRALQRAIPFLRRQIGSRLRLKRVAGARVRLRPVDRRPGPDRAAAQRDSHPRPQRPTRPRPPADPPIPTMMTTSPEIQNIVDAIRARQRFVISSHSRPDGDSIGSQLAMAYALQGARQGGRGRQRRSGAGAADGVSRRPGHPHRPGGGGRVRRRDHHGVRRPGADRRHRARAVLRRQHRPPPGQQRLRPDQLVRRGGRRLRRDGVRPRARARRCRCRSRSRRTSTWPS